jgi:hypothetical protein
MRMSSIDTLLRMLSGLSGFEALVLGFLVFCALGGVLVAMYVGIRSLGDARAERRGNRPKKEPH